MRNIDYQFLQGHVIDKLRTLPDKSIHCCITSPPYFRLRDYDVPPSIWGGKTDCDHTWDKVDDDKICKQCLAYLGAFGHESRHDCLAWARGEEPCGGCYICRTRMIFKELHRVLRDDGNVWWNVGDSFDRSNLIGVPFRVALAIQSDRWYLRSDIIWQKSNALPSPVKSRPTSSHEYILLFTKSQKYYYDYYAIREPLKYPNAKGMKFGGTKHAGNNGNPIYSGNEYDASSLQGKNKRDVWTLSLTHDKAVKHYATYPLSLPTICIQAGTSEKGCCSKCGAPYVRVLERKGGPKGDHTKKVDKLDASSDAAQKTGRTGKASGSTLSNAYKEHGYAEISTSGWKASCDCNAEIVPCTVLDPFSGAGTTMLAALKLGRKSIGIELNKEYIEMAENRIKNHNNATKHMHSRFCPKD